MIVNGKFFHVYILDTVDTIKIRIANQLNTLPQFLLFKKPLSVDSDIVEVENLIDLVWEKETLKMPSVSENIKRELEQIFIATHVALKEHESEDNILGILLKSIDGLSLDPSELWRKREQIIKSFNKERRDIFSSVEYSIHFFKEFENKPSKFTQFEPSFTQFSVKLGETELSLLSFFDSLATTKDIPFMTCNGVYKIFHTFVPSQNWLNLNQQSNFILLKVNNERDLNIRELKNVHEKYTIVLLTIVESTIIATINLNIGHRYVPREEFMDRIFKTFKETNWVHNERSVSENAVIGYFMFPERTFHIPVWADLTMNHNIFNSLVAIDESIRSSKIKENVYLHVLKTKDSLSFITKQTPKPNTFGMEKEGTFYVHVRVKTRTLSLAEKYQKLLNTLFFIYDQEETKIIQEYRLFLPNFCKEPKKKKENIRTKVALKDIAPEIFFSNYTRRCLNPPRIVSDEEAKDLESQNFVVMRFPKFGEAKTRNYACDHYAIDQQKPGRTKKSKTIFPGLLENKLDNKNDIPLIPCCYSNDQRLKKNSNYNHYFNHQSLKPRQPQIQDLFVTNKILQRGIFGILPKMIKKIFYFCDSNRTFVRVGVRRSKHSFLEAVLVAKKIININDENNNVVEKFIDELSEEVFIASAKQEQFSLSVDEIRRKLRSECVIATEFVHMLEERFECDIFIFSSERMVDGEIIIPPHSQFYVKTTPTRDTIFIYQHMGSESDNADYPQCEIISQVFTKKGMVTDFVTTFSPDNLLVQKMFTVFNINNRTFSSNEVLVPLTLKKLNIISQFVDSFGKCRMITVLFDNEMGTLMTTPLPPFAVKETTDVIRSKLEFVEKVANYLDISLIRQVVVEGKTVEVVGKSNSFEVIFLCSDERKFNFPTLVTPSFSTQQNIFSDINEFRLKKKVANIIFQYCLKLIAQKETIPISDVTLVKFFKENTILRENHSYIDQPLVDRFDQNSGFLDDNGKLIVTSEEMQKRLIYMVKIFQRNKINVFRNFNGKLEIDGFFSSVFDFKTRDTEIVLKSTRAVSDFIKSTEFFNKTVDHVQTVETPYFFFNDRIIDKICCAFNVESIDSAFNLLSFWKKNRFVPTSFSKTASVVKKTSLFSSIIEYHPTNPRVIRQGEGVGVILVYANEKFSCFTVLIPLEFY